MVVRGNSSPDPSNKPDENFVPGDIGVYVTNDSNSEEEEEISYEGYEVLSQEVVENSGTNVSESEDSLEDETDVIIDVNSIPDPPSFDHSTKLEVTELWNSSWKQGDIVMDSVKEEQIKNAMAGFKLPPSAIPSWASEIPEEEWKEKLKNRVALLNKVSAV